MSRIKNILVSLIFCIQVLLTFFLFVGDKVKLPVWLQVMGRLHPLILHLPIGLSLFFLILLLLPQRIDLERETLSRITFIVLLFTSFTASLTALFGFLLSLQGDYGSTLLMRHKISSTILSWLCYLVLINYENLRNRKVFFYGTISLMMLAILFSGHTGATLTHGENFVFGPIVKESNQLLTVENSSVYQLGVQPILEKKCYSCHNDSKAKGKLVMTTIKQFVKGGKHGKEWVEGKPEESNLIKVIHLPLTHDKHMPPDGKAQLSGAEVHFLETWIRSGADFEKKMAELKPTDSFRIMTSQLLVKPEQVIEKKYSFNPAPDKVINNLNSPFCSLFPLYENSPALRADFFVQQAFNLKTLEMLKEVEDQLVELNLAHMPITDEELSIIGKFKNLEKLNLNFTKISSGLKELKPLTQLTSLSLSGTKVNAQSLSDILPLPQLTELFVWNTPITNNEQLAINQQYPNLSIVWNLFRDDQPIVLSKPSLVNEGVFKKNERVILKHVMPGATIRYTMDNTSPDSVHGKLYESPIKIESTVYLKACAYKEGWLQSDIYQVMCFVDGYKAKEIELLTKPDPQYVGEGAKSLMDSRKGLADQFKEASWLGFKENEFEAGFYFGQEAPAVKNIVISYGRNTGSYIFPPAQVELWAGNEKQKISLIKTINVAQPKSNESAKVDALIIPLVEANYAYYKIIAKPIKKLPAWHSGKGQKGWFFVDEVFFN